MYVQSKKTSRWTGKDYVKIIVYFLANYVVLGGLFVAAIFFNCDMSVQRFTEYFVSENGLNNFLYLMIAVFLILVVLFLFYYFEDGDFIKKPKNVIMMFTIIYVSLIVSYCIGKWGSIYARPIALCALLSLLLINRQTAIFMNITMCMIMFLLDKYTGATYLENYANAEFSALLIGFSAGLIGIYLVSGVNSRIKVFFMGFVISVPIIISMFVLEGMDLSQIPLTLLTGVSAGILSVSFEMVLLPIFELLFNALTDYRLSELTDHKNKLLKKLIELAPGTFNHSLIVANLAEACASAIGESSQVARCAAYYHDIGKIANPAFFTENQQGSSPHDELPPELSAQIIIRHTSDGKKILKRNRLPAIIADIAVEHHGTLPVRFFYVKASKLTDGDLDIKDFSYPGPKPQSKIAAIIMVADGCEAKVRTLKDRSHANVDRAIKEIIEERMDMEQFTDCDITLKDLDIIRNTLVNSLAGVYHDRVVYPKLKLGQKDKQKVNE